MDSALSEFTNNLITLHKFGLLTVSGQESRCEYAIPSDTRLCDIEQRGYLSFYINLETHKEFIDSLITELKFSNLIFVTFNLKTGEQISNMIDIMSLANDYILKMTI